MFSIPPFVFYMYAVYIEELFCRRIDTHVLWGMVKRKDEMDDGLYLAKHIRYNIKHSFKWWQLKWLKVFQRFSPHDSFQLNSYAIAQTLEYISTQFRRVYMCESETSLKSSRRAYLLPIVAVYSTRFSTPHANTHKIVDLTHEIIHVKNFPLLGSDNMGNVAEILLVFLVPSEFNHYHITHLYTYYYYSNNAFLKFVNTPPSYDASNCHVSIQKYQFFVVADMWIIIK